MEKQSLKGSGYVFTQPLDFRLYSKVVQPPHHPPPVQHPHHAIFEGSRVREEINIQVQDLDRESKAIIDGLAIGALSRRKVNN